MDDLNRLFSEYKEAYQGGEGDPRPFLDRAAPSDRALLAALIDTFLEEAPRREYSQDAAGGAAGAVTDEVHRTLAGTSGLWPALLPRLRGRARLRRGGGGGPPAAPAGARGAEGEGGAFFHPQGQGGL